MTAAAVLMIVVLVPSRNRPKLTAEPTVDRLRFGLMSNCERPLRYLAPPRDPPEVERKVRERLQRVRPGEVIFVIR